MAERKTHLAHSIAQTDVKARYDAACKKLLSHKIILAWIMKSCLAEYKNLDVAQIAANYIEGEPQVAKYSVHADAVKQYDTDKVMIHGTHTEHSTQTEGTVRYDIRFRAIAPGKPEPVEILFNVEAQNQFYPGYPLLKRGIYYCSRMLSAQYGTEFVNGNYEKLKKVYSIWICMHPPGKRQNSINSYVLTEVNQVGQVKERPDYYDLLTAVVICLGDEEQQRSEGAEADILRLLQVLLSDRMPVEEKQKILEKEFGIAMWQELESEVAEMCNLSDGVWERGLREGRKEGRKEGRQKAKKEEQQKMVTAIKNLMEVLKVSAEQAMEYLKLPQEDRLIYKTMLQ